MHNRKGGAARKMDAVPAAAAFFGHKVRLNRTSRSERMEQIPDDPIVHEIEETGWPWWLR